MRVFIVTFPNLRCLKENAEFHIRKIDMMQLMDKVKFADKVYALDLYASMFLSAFQVNHEFNNTVRLTEWFDELILINMFDGGIYLITYILPEDYGKFEI